MLDRLGPEHASAGLDVGCGYGADVEALADRLRPAATQSESTSARP